MTSSAFSGPKPHRWTPQICWPPPPPLPLPRGIPCLRGRDGQLVHFKVDAHLRNPYVIPNLTPTYSIQGITNLGYGPNEFYFSAAVSNATFLNATVKLSCRDDPPVGHKWYALYSGTIIMPSGRLLNFHADDTWHYIQDDSAVDGYTWVKFTYPPTSDLTDGFFVETVLVQFYTAGAPIT